MVIGNRSPRVSRTRGSTSLTAAICRSRTPARSSPAVIVERSAWCPRCQARSQAAQPFDLGVDLGLLEDQRVAGRDRFELGEAEHVIADVLDLANVKPAAHHLVDEPGFALDRLPHVGVKRPFGDVAVDPDGRVLVALAQDPPVALGDVRRPPRNVDVVQGDRPRLDVGADAHLLRRADDHADLPGAAGREQPGLLDVVAGLVDVADPVGGNAAVDELVAQLVVGVPPLPSGRGQVAEHDLQRAAASGDGWPVTGSR